jgi:ABC-2 type transport system ATP-binding protein
MTTPFDDVTVGPTPTGTTPGAATPFAAGPSRFAPGAIVAGRYRLVALLGRGGMGEVYRADDLTLDQPVALKFLPQGVAPTAAGERQAEAMLEAHGITKRYSGALALDKVSFRVRRGEIVGYLGPNGSGKSTTVNIVVGLLEPTSGSVTLDGRTLSEDPPGYQKKIGYVPEEPYLYAHLTATEYLTLIARLRRLPHAVLEDKIPELLRLFQLRDSRYSTMAAFSKGMRQRVLLAAALLHNPDLLVLDEPFAGLDVNAGLLFRALLGMLAADGHMILFSTHRFDMVEKLCSRVVILSSGRIVAEDDVAAFGSTHSR